MNRSMVVKRSPMRKYIDLLFNVEYTLSLTLSGLMQHYTLVYNCAGRIDVNVETEFRYLLDKYVEFIGHQRKFFINSFFYFPWNHVCSLLPWERTQELQPVFCADTQALKRYQEKQEHFRKRLNVLLLPIVRRNMMWEVVVQTVVAPMGLKLPVGLKWSTVKSLYQVFLVIENTVL
jgi:hypothetical protein